ncbi:hypothetical protein BC940DRAFT_57686 [Gongronella butleri]|nr:hypothetical protein BC940DRAFT_57686 [Gongronella butleri]
MLCFVSVHCLWEVVFSLFLPFNRNKSLNLLGNALFKPACVLPPPLSQFSIHPFLNIDFFFVFGHMSRPPPTPFHSQSTLTSQSMHEFNAFKPVPSIPTTDMNAPLSPISTMQPVIPSQWKPLPQKHPVEPRPLHSMPLPPLPPPLPPHLYHREPPIVMSQANLYDYDASASHPLPPPPQSANNTALPGVSVSPEHQFFGHGVTAADQTKSLPPLPPPVAFPTPQAPFAWSSSSSTLSTNAPLPPSSTAQNGIPLRRHTVGTSPFAPPMSPPVFHPQMSLSLDTLHPSHSMHYHSSIMQYPHHSHSHPTHSGNVQKEKKCPQWQSGPPRPFFPSRDD